MHTPRERWVKRVMKVLISGFQFIQIPSTSHIRLIHTNPPKVPDGTRQKNCSLTLPNTPSSSHGKGGSKAFINSIIKILKAYGFDLETEHGLELSVIRLEPLSGLDENRSLRSITTINSALMELAKEEFGILRCKLDPGYKEYLNYLCKEKGMTQGQVIEEALELYERNQ